MICGSILSGKRRILNSASAVKTFEAVSTPPERTNTVKVHTDTSRGVEDQKKKVNALM